jgi:hypothetical protein
MLSSFAAYDTGKLMENHLRRGLKKKFRGKGFKIQIDIIFARCCLFAVAF